MYLNFIKPLFDRLAAAVLLMITLPLTIPSAGLLWIFQRGSIFFIQPRPGLNGKIFNIVKFRTMSEVRDQEGNPLPDAFRLTKVGSWIRKLSLDEIPQLINVLMGNMSLVGPRPLLVDYLPLYNSQQMRRHEVRPGITGWAQVNGRNALDWQTRFSLDVWYVDHVTFWLDLRIIGLTVWRVIKAEGITSSTSATMEKFQGND